ncbi:recombination related exonuclease [Staphylococcus phage vB_SauM-V1SA22]|nr:recombination related exonuclease [Staphylococcus phage vB_SauM-V1SA22]
MVKFNYVEMNNFLAIEHIKLNLDKQGLVLIEGINKTNDSFESNGTSKTSMISSITYALFGKTEKGLKADDVVNKYKKKDTYVKLSFNIGKDEYLIERYRKHKEHKNKVKLFCNNKEITGSTNDVTDTQIQELFGIPFNTYVNAIIYGQGDIPMFSQATDKGKKEILESITKTDIYKQAQEVAKEKVKEVEEKQSKEQQEIEKLEYKRNLKQEQYNNEVNKYNNLLERKKQEEEQFNQKKQEYENKLKDLDNQISVCKGSIPKVEDFEFVFSENYTKANQGIEKINTNINDKLLPLLSQETTNKNTTLNIINQLKQSINKLDTNDHCPVCGSPIDNTHKIKEKENLELQIKEEQAKISQYEHNEQTIINKKEELLAKSKELQQFIQQEDIEKKKHDDDIQRQYREQQEVYDEISQLENTKANLKEPILNDYSYIEEPNEELHNKELKDIDNTIDKHKENIVQLESKKTKYKQAVDAFSNKGLRSVILDFITPFLNEKANEYLQILAGSDIEIEFQTQVENAKGELKDKFDVIVKNNNGGESYKSNSAGEQKRIDLAISFAIQDLIMSKEDISTNIALYDECFDGLDTIGCENVVKLLKDRLKTVGTIFVITHNKSLAPLFENTITIVKENGVATLRKELNNETKD